MSIWTTGWEKGTTRGWARGTLRAPILTGAHLRVPQCIHSMRRHISTFPLYIITITGHWPSNKASRLALSHDFKWTLGSQRCYSPCLKAVLTRSPSSRSFSVTMLLILPGIFWRKKGSPIILYLIPPANSQTQNCVSTLFSNIQWKTKQSLTSRKFVFTMSLKQIWHICPPRVFPFNISYFQKAQEMVAGQ